MENRNTFHFTIQEKGRPPGFGCPVELFVVVTEAIAKRWPDAVMAEALPGAMFAIEMDLYPDGRDG